MNIQETTDPQVAIDLLVQYGYEPEQVTEPISRWLDRGDDVIVFSLADLSSVAVYPHYWVMPWEREDATPTQAPDTQATGLGWRYQPVVRVATTTTTPEEQTMNQYTFTLVGTFEADTEAEARVELADWLTMPGVSDHATVVVLTGKDLCRTRSHHNWDREAPAMFAPEAEAYFASLTEPLTSTCLDCGLTRTDGPNGGRYFARGEQS